MSSNVGVTIEATRVAFQIGQSLERLLLERGVELASATGTPNVSAEQVQSCLSPALFDEMVSLVKEPVDKPSGQCRAEERNPGEAA